MSAQVLEPLSAAEIEAAAAAVRADERFGERSRFVAIRAPIARPRSSKLHRSCGVIRATTRASPSECSGRSQSRKRARTTTRS